jgi:heterotetrameric sarcosine oxidase delta subunit
MSFLLDCPSCGKRSVYEFLFGGETRQRPALSAPQHDWTAYIYMRANSTGVQTEWWYHRHGCRQWFLAERNTTTNDVLASYRPGEKR